MPLEPVKRLLSAQSHVVHGYVGNKAATFPLQCQGWDVDVLNTVNFSNHTGYGSVQGTKASPSDLLALYEGLKNVGCEYDAFLTGYVPGADGLQVIADIGLDIKTRNPESLWLLDPVMGDEGQLYVSDTVIPVYRKILSKGGVDIITPNQFEAELLVDFKIDSKETLQRALIDLHTKLQVQNVVISSLKFTDIDQILTITSTNFNGQIVSNYFEIPLIDSYFTGVGDLFSALLVDRVSKHLKTTNDSSYLVTAVNEVLSVMSTVLRVTSEAAQKALGNKISLMGSKETMKEAELRLIECRDVFGSNEKKFTPLVL